MLFEDMESQSSIDFLQKEIVRVINEANLEALEKEAQEKGFAINEGRQEISTH